MGKTFKKRPPQEPQPDNERRRVGTVVHDDRGNASVSWRNAPGGEPRDVLELLGGPLSIKTDDNSDPYARARADNKPKANSSTARTDLRKLSEHIKKMRELEERKRNNADED